jgi:hypothetical protein
LEGVLEAVARGRRESAMMLRVPGMDWAGIGVAGWGPDDGVKTVLFFFFSLSLSPQVIIMFIYF